VGAAQLPRSYALALFHGDFSFLDFLLHFLRGLPKEEIGRDGGAQETD